MDNASPSLIPPDVKAEAKGLLGSILDFRFDSFVTPKIVKAIYCLMLLAVVGNALLFFVTSLTGGLMGVVIGVVGAPILLAVGAVLARVFVELIMLAFKMLETLQRIEAKSR